MGTVFEPGAAVPISISFTPSGPGPVVATLAVPTSAGIETISVSGYGTAPGLVLSSEPLAFGTVDTGAGGRELTITVTNSWSHPETVTGYNLPAGPYRVTGLPAVGTVLAPQQTVTAAVQFTPTTAGAYPSTLRISTNHGSAGLPVSGTAVTGVAQLAVSDTSVDAGNVPVGRAATVTFEVGDRGTVALRITRAIAPSGAFSAPVPVPEGTTLDPGTFLTQTVVFRPTSIGPTTSRYIFNSDAGHGPVTVTLTGIGT